MTITPEILKSAVAEGLTSGKLSQLTGAKHATVRASLRKRFGDLPTERRKLNRYTAEVCLLSEKQAQLSLLKYPATREAAEQAFFM